MGQHSSLYKTARWKRLRDAQLHNEPMCRMCRGRGQLTPATVADHVIPHRGDEDMFWNGELQSLCAPCHSHYKQRHEAGSYSGACDADGMPVDANHPWNREGRGKSSGPSA